MTWNEDGFSFLATSRDDKTSSLELEGEIMEGCCSWFDFSHCSATFLKQLRITYPKVSLATLDPCRFTSGSETEDNDSHFSRIYQQPIVQQIGVGPYYLLFHPQLTGNSTNTVSYQWRPSNSCKFMSELLQLCHSQKITHLFPLFSSS